MKIFQAEEAARGKLEAKLPGQVSLMTMLTVFTTPLCIDLGSPGLSEFDGGLGQLSQRKILSFCHKKLSWKCLFAFPQGGHDGHCAAGVPAPLDEGVWPVLG